MKYMTSYTSALMNSIAILITNMTHEISPIMHSLMRGVKSFTMSTTSGFELTVCSRRNCRLVFGASYRHLMKTHAAENSGHLFTAYDCAKN